MITNNSNQNFNVQSYNLDINGDNQSVLEDGEWGYKIIKTGPAFQFMEYWMLGISFTF